jgi:hypothetical protein
MIEEDVFNRSCTLVKAVPSENFMPTNTSGVWRAKGTGCGCLFSCALLPDQDEAWQIDMGVFAARPNGFRHGWRSISDPHS